MRTPRPFRRHRRRLPVRFASKGTGWRSSVTTNLSAGGLFVVSAGQSRPGRVVELELRLPGETPLRLTGEVVWQRVVPPHLHRISPGGFGVRLSNAPEAYFRYCLGLETGGHAAGPVAVAEAQAL